MTDRAALLHALLDLAERRARGQITDDQYRAAAERLARQADAPDDEDEGEDART